MAQFQTTLRNFNVYTQSNSLLVHVYTLYGTPTYIHVQFATVFIYEIFLVKIHFDITVLFVLIKLLPFFGKGVEILERN